MTLHSDSNLSAKSIRGLCSCEAAAVTAVAPQIYLLHLVIGDLQTGRSSYLKWGRGDLAAFFKAMVCHW